MKINLLTIKEAAELLCMSVVTLRRFVHSGQIGYKQIGKRHMFTPEHIREYLERVDVAPLARGGKGAI